MLYQTQTQNSRKQTDGRKQALKMPITKYFCAVEKPDGTVCRRQHSSQDDCCALHRKLQTDEAHQDATVQFLEAYIGKIGTGQPTPPPPPSWAAMSDAAHDELVVWIREFVKTGRAGR